MAEQVCKNCGAEIVELQGAVEGKKYWRHANGYQTCEQKPITRAEPSPEPEAAPVEKEKARICNCGKLEHEHRGKQKLCPGHPYTFSERKPVAEPQQAAPIKRYTASIGGDKTVWPIIVPDASGQLCYYRDHVAQIAALKQSLGDCVEALKKADKFVPSLTDPFKDDCDCSQCILKREINSALAAAAKLEAR